MARWKVTNPKVETYLRKLRLSDFRSNCGRIFLNINLSCFHIFLSCLQSEQVDRLLLAFVSKDVGAGDCRSGLKFSWLWFAGSMTHIGGPRSGFRLIGSC